MLFVGAILGRFGNAVVDAAATRDSASSAFHGFISGN
jgi:hypothetical protein